MSKRQTSTLATFSVFILGATGYIGGSFFTALRKEYPQASITAIVRAEKDGAILLAAGAQRVILGTHQDIDIIRSAAQEADVIINAGDADDIAMVRSLLEGMKSTKISSGRLPIFVHISGVALAIEDVRGDFTAGTKAPINDLDIDAIRAIPDAAIHRNVDNLIFAADTAGEINGYIISPGTVYGTGTGPCKRLCLVFPTLLRIARQHREIFVVGDSTNVWDEVHINDLTSLFLLIFRRARNGEDAPSTPSHAKFYWAAARPFVWGDVFRAAAGPLASHGVIERADIVHLSYEEAIAKEGWLYHMLSTNSRVDAQRARSIGWEPKANLSMVGYTPEGMVAAITQPQAGTVILK